MKTDYYSLLKLQRLYYLVMYILTFVSLSVCAQQKILTFEDYIGAVLDEPKVSIYNNKINFLDQNNGQSPILRELEFRTETDEWNLTRQEYLLRSSFNGKKEREKEQAYYDSNKSVIEAEKKVEIHDEIVDRYTNWLNYLLLREKQSIIKKRILLAEDKMAILKTKAALTVDFNLNEYIKTEDQFHDAKRQQLMLEHELQLINATIAQGVPNIVFQVIDTSQLIAIERVGEVLNQITDTAYIHPDFEERSSQINQLQKEYELEQVQDQQILDFVQLKYAGRDNSDLVQEFSFGMGINIPLKNINQVKLNEILLEVLENEDKLSNDKYYNTLKINQQKLYINLLTEQYQLLEEQSINSQSFYSAQTYEKLVASDPVMLLQIEESLLLREQKKLDLKIEIYTLYINILDDSGLLSQLPFINYLK